MEPIIINHAKRFSGTNFNSLLNTSKPSVRSIKLNMKPFIKFIISFQKNEKIAIKVPI